MKKLRNFLKKSVCVLLLFLLVLPVSSQALNSGTLMIRESELNLLEMNLKLLESINAYQLKDLERVSNQLIESEAEKLKAEESYENVKILLQESEKERKKELIETAIVSVAVGVIFGSLLYGMAK